jgi:hypothetical protein
MNRDVTGADKSMYVLKDNILNRLLVEVSYCCYPGSFYNHPRVVQVTNRILYYPAVGVSHMASAFLRIIVYYRTLSYT